MISHALVCKEKGVVELQELEIEDPAENQLQVRVMASLISPGTERAFALNLENTTGKYPSYPGYSSAGVVEKIGKNVSGFKAGDRIACHGIGHRSSGNVHLNRVVQIPEGVSFEKAAFTAMGVIALQGVRKARIELGESTMVFGLGLVGQLALQFARLNGAVPAIGIDRVGNRIEVAKSCGADIGLNSSDDNWKETLLEHTNGIGPHVVVESTGFPDVISTSFETVRDFGRVIILSSTRGDSTINFYRDVHKKALTIIGAHISSNPLVESRPGYWIWHDNAQTFLNLVKLDKMCLDPIITHRVSWQHIEEAYKDMLTWNTNMIGTVIDWK